jgi:diguanylate cyclase (GGDEF)-like protein
MGSMLAVRDVPSDLSDASAGESNRQQLTEVLRTALEEALKLRSSCGFLLVAVDDLGRIVEAHGRDIGDAIIATVAKRLRAQLRGKDHIGRYAGDTFGIVINSCTAEAMQVAADRLLAGVRDEVVQTDAGPLTLTVTIGGVIAPRHGRTLREVLARALEAFDEARTNGGGAFQSYRPNAEPRQLARAS